MKELIEKVVDAARMEPRVRLLDSEEEAFHPLNRLGPNEWRRARYRCGVRFAGDSRSSHPPGCDPGAAKREIARSFPVRPWALSQARGA